MLTTKGQIYQFLSFSLTPKLQAMLLTEQLSEVLNIELGQIVPVFDVPAAIMGVYNRRGEVLWVVDLAYLLELEALLGQNYHNMCHLIVIGQGHLVAGLAVRQMGQFIFCSSSQIGTPTSINSDSRLAKCLNGEKRTTDEQKLLILDAEKILNLLKNLA